MSPPTAVVSPQERSATAVRFVASLDQIEAASIENEQRCREVRSRIRHIRKEFDKGIPLADIMAAQESPRAVELVSANIATLETAGSEFRAALAMELRAEGLTIEAIGDLFGVTRQRISALLRQKAARPH